MTPTHLIRFTQTLVLAALIAVLAAPTVALGNSNPGKAAPDVFERYVAAHPYGHGVLDTSTAPDVFERYVATYAPTALIDGRSPDTLDAAGTAQLQVTDGRSPDTRDAAGTPQFQVVDGRSPDTLDAAGTAQLQVADGRSPDTLDAAQTVQPIELVYPGGFDWSDAGIGAGMGAVLFVLLGSSILVLLSHRRNRVQAT